MANPEHVPLLDSFDRLTVRLYRVGLTVAALGVAAVAVQCGRSMSTEPAYPLVAAGTLLSVTNLHLYDKRVRWVIAGASQVGAVLLLLGLVLQHPVVQKAGLGFLFVTLSGFALKEQFCFRIPGLRLVPLFLAAGLVPLVFGWAIPGAILLGLATLPMLVLSAVKWRMPLHFDVGDKSRYQI